MVWYDKWLYFNKNVFINTIFHFCEKIPHCTFTIYSTFSLYSTIYFHACYYCYIVYILQLPIKSNLLSGDSLANHNGQRFSTFDRDQDAWSWGHCNQDHKWGGFWFHRCTNANTNGRYQWKNYRVNDGSGLNWSGWTVSSLKAISMKVRRFSLDD